jgi:hypothetical protein
VRKVEELVTDSKTAHKATPKVDDKYSLQRVVLEQKLGRKVKISAKQVTISFKNENDLNQLIALLS